MPRLSQLSRSNAIHDVSVASSTVLPTFHFLAPAFFESRATKSGSAHRDHDVQQCSLSIPYPGIEHVFHEALNTASRCTLHRGDDTTRQSPRAAARYVCEDAPRNTCNGLAYEINRRKTRATTERSDCRAHSRSRHRCEIKPHYALKGSIFSTTGERFSRRSKNTANQTWLGPSQTLHRENHTRAAVIEAKTPQTEANDLSPKFVEETLAAQHEISSHSRKHRNMSSIPWSSTTKDSSAGGESTSGQISQKTNPNIIQQMKLLSSVRELEEKLKKAKSDLASSMEERAVSDRAQSEKTNVKAQSSVLLTKEDYINLVDLYYYSHNSRFSPESTDGSPTPFVLEDYSFTLSSDFSPPESREEVADEDRGYESPLKQIEEMLKKRQLREVAVMQVFVDLLLDDDSSNRALFEAYKELPEPGVAHLPTGINRLFLQRMSTPWTLSEKSMLRYLSLIDDMQKAQLSITISEWSSAIYLAGRAFSRVTNQEVHSSFSIWHTMEREAGVKASHVTFNILFDIAVRSGKFALGESLLKEMHTRNLRLNRLGRVSLIYYHGLRKDGDGVRKAYRDFVEAGEIVDTLVLNCVIASLLNAQEPQAAEQIYARMMNMQSRVRGGLNGDGGKEFFTRYPDPGTNTIENEMASNHLGRILEKAPRLRQTLPDHHQALQASMPLTPDHITFRSIIAYHATTSGDLDRLTVLLKEMTEFFCLPLQTITFQLLFKGFAIHGPRNGPKSEWSVKRLDLCWNACRGAIKDSDFSKPLSRNTLSTSQAPETSASAEEDLSPLELTLPSITRIKTIPRDDERANNDPALSRPPSRRLSDWAEFVLDLAAFPRERLKRLERFHATMFDTEGETPPHEEAGIHTFRSPFFQSVAYTAPEPGLDQEEGEYTLPNPSGSGLIHGSNRGGDPETTHSDRKAPAEQPHQVSATKSLVCWLLRAYARTTKSRAKVEEVWGQIRKVYKPRDVSERESVMRVLGRCLRDCDQEGNG